MNFHKFLTILLFIFIPLVSSAEIEITHVQIADLVIFYYSDWEINPSLFSVTLQNTSDQEETFTLTVRILNEETDQEIYKGKSYVYTIAPNAARTLTNVDQFNYYKTIQFDEGTQDDILELGYIVAGTYCFNFQINDGAIISDPAWCFTITNPSNPVLFNPGSTDYANPVETPNPFPLFQWGAVSNSEAIYYEFTLAELQEGQTPFEAIENEPVLVANSQEDRNLFFPAVGPPSGLQYAGPENLVNGHIYCWQVVALVPTSSGYLEFPSEIWTFKVNQNIEIPEGAMEIIIDILEEAGIPQDVLELIEQGEIETVLLNGEYINIDQMMAELANANIISVGVSE